MTKRPITPAPGGEEPSGPERDEDFYFGEVTVKVDDTPFCIPGIFLEDSSEFFIKETLRRVPDLDIYIQDISVSDFRAFLSVLCTRAAAAVATTPVLTSSEWEAVFKLSKRWGFKQIEKIAQGALIATTDPPIRRMEIAIKNALEREMMPSAVMGFLSTQGSTVDEIVISRVGLRMALRIERLRGYLLGLGSATFDGEYRVMTEDQGLEIVNGWYPAPGPTPLRSPSAPAKSQVGKKARSPTMPLPVP
ncbi:hypothetical protein BDN72DRAFT_955660 [Pluteus cervinus]|uniref:Uncharacterized protein n=1 Tax=Pluteus cervinus TaxID=181527 RepID=A0ACD3BA09_9AGAR|nr:hypothetical protein BDN72DRAFT_955660 [Pluteus cervinus]